MKQKSDPPDPILDEIRETQRRLLAEHGGVAALAAVLRRKDAESGQPTFAPTPSSPIKGPVRRRRPVDPTLWTNTLPASNT